MGQTLRSNYRWIRSPQSCVYRGHNLVKYSKEVSKKSLKQCYQGNNTSSKRRASAQRQGLLILTRLSKWWQRKEGRSTYGTPLLTHKLKFEDSESVYVCVCVWLRPPAKHNLKNIPRNAWAVHVPPAISTPLSVGHVLWVVSAVVIMAHTQLSTPSSLVPLVTKDTHLLNSWRRARMPRLVIKKKKKIPLFKAKASKNRTFVLVCIINSVTANTIPSVTSV